MSRSTRSLVPLAMFTLMLVASRDARAESLPSVRVHLEDRSTRLERQTARGWELACDGACADTIPAGLYRMRRSKDGDLVGDPFQLDPEHTADVRLRPNRARPVFIGLGVLGMVTGGLAGLIGWAVSSFDGFCIGREADQPCPSRGPDTTATVVAAVGGIVFLAGTVSLIAGVRQPHVIVSQREPTFARSWRIPEPSRVPTASPAISFPILSGRF